MSDLRPGEGHALAAGIRLEAEEVSEGRGPWGGVTRTCVDCERQTIEHLEDGRCWQCNHPGEDSITPEQRAASHRRLFEMTAKYLRKAGHPDRADWYDEQLEKEK